MKKKYWSANQGLRSPSVGSAKIDLQANSFPPNWGIPKIEYMPAGSCD